MEPSREVDRHRCTLKELEEKTYPYPDSDVAGMLEDLLEKKVIELPKFRQRRIELDVEEIADANVATIVFGSFDPVPLPVLSKRSEFQATRDQHQVTNLCTKEVASEPKNRGADGFVGDSSFDDNEGWTLVTRQKGGVKKILGDVKPFTEVESYFADAKFYMEEGMVSEVIPAEVHSTGKGIQRKDEQSKCLSTKENGDNKSKSTAFEQMGSPSIDSQKVSILVLHYVSSSRRKEGQSPFGEEVKLRKLRESDMKFLKE
ncbi:unnamed protein product [Prunus brigantina]